MTVTVKKIGNSLMISIPTEFNINENQEYTPKISDDGTISFIPVHRNIYEEHFDYDYRKAFKEMAISDNGSLVGKENTWG